MSRVAARVLPPAATVALLLAGWIAVTAGGAVPAYVIPSPQAVVTALVDNWGDVLASATWLTGAETLAGIGLGTAVAVGMAVASGYLAVIGRALTPLLIASQAIPTVVIGPLLTIALGYGMSPKVIVVALLCFFPVALNLMAGIHDVDHRLIDTMRTLHAGRSALLWRVRIPAAAPRGFAGLRVAVTFAPVAAVFAEYTGSTNGIGYLMLQAIPRLATDLVFAQVIVLTAMSGLLLGAVTLIERLACPWNVTEGHS
ncbi:ABC transporter permease [Acidipropionibacterium virtanenii]|uniref:Riboflavin transport system permease protein RibX n=1 Tax=Acidipropionibacterium virtanenii TaxID=2057246 RepID=A0A344UTZ1_9ACTN|nr:ABC transporter permease [Acidipropionibacterium virtanenii]AXE38739.1 Riboflavin transport system permease protein RibX [Acidipropionibacterium virtanenii]